MVDLIDTIVYAGRIKDKSALGGFFISYTYKIKRPQGRKAGTGYVQQLMKFKEGIRTSCKIFRWFSKQG